MKATGHLREGRNALPIRIKMNNWVITTIKDNYNFKNTKVVVRGGALLVLDENDLIIKIFGPTVWLECYPQENIFTGRTSGQTEQPNSGK